MKQPVPVLNRLLPDPHRDEAIVLIHGLARSGASLMPMEAALRANGYQTVNNTYPSTSDTIAAIPNGLAEGGIARGMGHLIMMEQPERLAEACLGFLKRRGIL